MHGKRYCASRETDGVDLPHQYALIDHDRSVLMLCVIGDAV
jgi:hypothetical protein